MQKNYGRAWNDWQTGLINPIHKNGDRSECTNYRGISLLSRPGKVYAKCYEKRCREIIEPKLDDIQCGFRLSCSTTDQMFPLRQIFWKLGRTSNPSTFILSTSRKYTTVFLGETLESVAGVWCWSVLTFRDFFSKLKLLTFSGILRGFRNF